MNPSFTKYWRTAAAATVLTAALAGSALAASGPSDAWITTKAKLALMTGDGPSSNAVNVDTIDGQVTLHGTVSSADEKQKAEQAVRGVKGVANVRNLLQVVAPARQDAVQRKDNEISEDVTAALGRQTSLEDSSITVRSVNKGVVLLGGTAGNLSDRLTAVRTARSVPGVQRVESEIQGSEEVADSKMWQEREPARADRAEDRSVRETAKDAGGRAVDTGRDVAEGAKDTAKSAGGAVADAARGTGEVVGDAARATTGAASDLYATSMVKMRLLADRDTPAMDIHVDTNDGVVTLFGAVPSAAARQEAEAEARKVAGVKSVRNELQVVADAKAQPAAAQAKDEELASSVKQRLKERDSLRNVNADVKNCVVRLSGTVPSGEERVQAMQVARSTRGVCSVENDLHLNR
jgi:osmotically-inducible protein OsmY